MQGHHRLIAVALLLLLCACSPGCIAAANCEARLTCGIYLLGRL